MVQDFDNEGPAHLHLHCHPASGNTRASTDSSGRPGPKRRLPSLLPAQSPTCSPVRSPDPVPTARRCRQDGGHPPGHQLLINLRSSGGHLPAQLRTGRRPLRAAVSVRTGPGREVLLGVGTAAADGGRPERQLRPEGPPLSSADQDERVVLAGGAGGPAGGAEVRVAGGGLAVPQLRGEVPGELELLFHAGGRFHGPGEEVLPPGVRRDQPAHGLQEAAQGSVSALQK